MKINFIPFRAENFELQNKPIPALNDLPAWYKQLSPFMNNANKFQLNQNSQKNVTVKWCNPFGDALGAGYYVLLEASVFVTGHGPEKGFNWLSGGSEIVSTHDKLQIDSQAIPKGYNSQPFKFQNFWGVKLPKGYSAIFTHPMNRTELPFYTLSGIVDTDDYNNPVNFPFFIREDFVGVIEAGTPIAQIIPFKRESWKAVFDPFDQRKTQTMTHKFFQYVFRPYKRFYWKRKEWK